MPNLLINNEVDLPVIFNGGLILLQPLESVYELNAHATNIVENCFEQNIFDITTNEFTNLSEFVDKAKACKSTFSNDSKTHTLLRQLILERYKKYSKESLLFDVPRLRIVPNSLFLSSGISYNYKPHRDTWYGGDEDQVNHWMNLANASADATFYISPNYFFRSVSNNSEIFDLDEWVSKYRPLAEKSVQTEARPHPIPLEEISENDQYKIVMPPGFEVVFSGHHLHGSAPNTTKSVRFSIDYRVCVKTQEYSLPKNIDNRATGVYKNSMLKV